MAVMFPRESARLISNLAKHVSISPNGIKNVVDLLEKPFLENSYNIKKWKEHTLNPKTMDKEAINWIFMVDTLNFSFWSTNEKSKCQICYNDNYYTGYWAFCAAVNKALQKGIPICDPSFYSNITKEQLADILHPDLGDNMPLLEERYRVLRESGDILLKKFDGTFTTVISQCNQSAEKLLKLIIENFPSYRDEVQYGDHKVSFYKRAQILIGDIWACCEGQGFGRFHDIDFITVFADYRIPQLLLHLGALKYSEELMEELMTGKELAYGSEKEIEIRGCTIQAAELIREELRKRIKTQGTSVNAVLIDYFLWDYRRSHQKETESSPFHKVRCIYY